VRQETGVDTAIQSIYRDLEYATSLVKSKAGKNAAAATAPEATTDEDDEESWTFVGGSEDNEPELLVKKAALAEKELFAGAGARGVKSPLGSGLLSASRVGAAPAAPFDSDKRNEASSAGAPS
jgi:sterol 3beta-glucosyltransferase